MTGHLFAKSAVWVAEESGGISVDPSSDGSGYLPLNAIDPVHLADGKEPNETAYQNDQDWPTEPEDGADGWSFAVKIAARGLPDEADDGESPGAVDVDDLLLLNAWGTRVDVDGHGVAVGSTTSDVELAATPTFGLQDLLPIWDSTLATLIPLRTQWALATAVAGTTFTVYPTLAVAPTDSAEAKGTRRYSFLPGYEGTLSFLTREDQYDYLCQGGKIVGAELECAVNARAMWTFNVQGDTYTRTAKGATHTSRPAHTRSTHPACLGLRSPFWFNDTALEVESVKVSFGLTANHRPSMAAANGRAVGQNIRMRPTITVVPKYMTEIEDWYRATGGPTAARALWQIGGGVSANDRLNTCALAAHRCWVSSYQKQDRGGEKALQVTLTVGTDVEHSAGVTSRVLQYARS